MPFEELEAWVDGRLGIFTDREARMYRARYGFAGLQSATLEALGRELGVKRQRIFEVVRKMDRLLYLERRAELFLEEAPVSSMPVTLFFIRSRYREAGVPVRVMFDGGELGGKKLEHSIRLLLDKNDSRRTEPRVDIFTSLAREQLLLVPGLGPWRVACIEKLLATAGLALAN